MITYEQDPDVVQWGLRFFESDPYSDCSYCNTEVQNDISCYQGHYVTEDHYGVQCNDVECDEIIARALQEELSQLAVTETPGSPSEVSEQLQPSIFSQDWNGHPIGRYGSGGVRGHHTFQFLF
ncbi:hypothetical protein SAY86_023659 [Trapa natans]|uniref:Uncharacterized protein n=1 Tax=Trapa natans TaxID=22666 RepID=A0AAN7LW55_TRANT|nr:hypothetical protein SAY86_023659 [Trapa natans]